MKRILVAALMSLALVVAGGVAVVSATAGVGGPPIDIWGCTPDETYNFVIGECQLNGTPFTICHVAGLADDPANLVTITVAISAAIGQAGHFDENGSTNAGHEQDYVGACGETPPVIDVCPNLGGDQATLPEGYELSLGLCVKPDPAPTPELPPVKTSHEEKCPKGESVWKGKCYPNDEQRQPDGSVIYGEQG